MSKIDRPLRIFVVDDHRDVAEGLADVLRMHGHEVEVAFNGEQAVRIFRERDFDIAFMDVMMPGMNGVESFLEIRKIKPAAKVIMMTGYSVEQLLDQAVENKAYGVLHKPVAIHDVMETLERVQSQGMVLVADDDPDFSATIKQVLEDRNYKVCLARTGSEALKTVLGGGVDILVLDLELPVISGLEVYMQLRKRGRAVPTVVVTGHGQDQAEAIDALRAVSTTGILTKPFDSAQLFAEIDKLVLPPQQKQAQPETPPRPAPGPQPAPERQPAQQTAPEAPMPPPEAPLPPPQAPMPGYETQSESEPLPMQQAAPEAPSEPESWAAPEPESQPAPEPPSEPESWAAPEPKDEPQSWAASEPAAEPESWATPEPKDEPNIWDAPEPQSRLNGQQPPAPAAEPTRAEAPRAERAAPPKPPAPSSQTSAASVPEKRGERFGRILAVDDDVDMVEGLAEVLRARGYTVETANNAEDTQSLITEFDAQVALLDIRLGRSNGLELIPVLKEHRPNIYCVMITGNADKESAITALRIGAYDYLTKPLHPNELFAILDRCLEKYDLERRLSDAFEALQGAKDHAEKASREGGAFLANLTRELGDPINSIISSSNLFVDESLGPLGSPQYGEHATSIRENASQIARTMSCALELAKAQAGILELQEDEVDLSGIMSTVARSIRDVAGSTTPEIQVDIMDDAPRVWGDEHHFKQMLVHLLSNAVKYTPENGSIKLGLQRTADGSLAIEVSDNGIGMPPAQIPHALSQFGRVDGQGGPSYPGAGLGLPLVAALAELHGGELRLESEIGAGTRATIILPAQRIASRHADQGPAMGSVA